MRTSGKVHQSPGQIRITSQPGLKDGWIWRSSGVDRRSDKVLERNALFAKKMAGNSNATACKGKTRSAFFSCLRTQGKASWAKG